MGVGFLFVFLLFFLGWGEVQMKLFLVEVGEIIIQQNAALISFVY